MSTIKRAVQERAEKLKANTSIQWPADIDPNEGWAEAVEAVTAKLSRRPIVCSSASTVTDEHGTARVVEIVTDGDGYHPYWARMTEAERDEADAWTVEEHAARCAELP